MNEKEFIEKLISHFPEVSSDILDGDYEGLFSLQIGVFRSYTQQAINTGDLATVSQCFEFIDSVFDQVTDSVENSIVLSFFQKLNFQRMPKAEKKLSKRVREMISELNKYHANAKSNEKLQDFLKSLE